MNTQSVFFQLVFFFLFGISAFENNIWTGCFGVVELVWLCMDRSRSLSISKYPALLLTGSIFSPRELGIIGIEKFLIYASVKLLNWLGEAAHIPNQNFLRGIWGGILKQKKDFLFLSETLPEEYLRLRYLHSCWHCSLCGYSCCVLPQPQTVACASFSPAKVWTVCNIFRYLISIWSRWCLANQHAHSCKHISLLKCDLIFTSMCKFAGAAWYRKLQYFFFPSRRGGCGIKWLLQFKKKKNFLCVFSDSSKCLDLRVSTWKPENLFALVEPVAQMPSKTIRVLEVIYFSFFSHKTAYLFLRDHRISSAFVSFSLFS